MKKFFAVILSLALLLAVIPLGTFAVSAETSGDFYYTVTGGEATITGCETNPTGNLVIPATLDGYPVTTIGSSAFDGCTKLTSVTIPDSVTTIGDYAFYDCTGLTSVTIPDSVTSIGDCAFYRCFGLTGVTIPDSVTTIGDGAFYRCTGLTSITVAPDNPVYHSAGNCLIETASKTLISGCKTSVIPTDGSVTTIDDSAFNGCTELTSVTIPASVTTIGDGAFYWCTGLTGVTIPDSVTTIGKYAFYHCTGLTSVTIPDSVTTIGNSAFEDCTGLTSVTIGNSVTTIGDEAFRGCTGLTSVTISDSVTTIGSSAFYGCTGLTSVTIPNSVTTIGDEAFYRCTGLTSVTIGDSVTTIGSSAFSNCTGLTSVTIPDSVTTIGDYAFAYCRGLTSVTIPNSVTTIGSSAFYYCTGLTSVTIPNSVTTIGNKAFSGCNNLTIRCYPGSYAMKYAINNNIPYTLLVEITGIAVKQLPDKTVYPLDGTLKTDGLVLTLTFSDGTTRDISSGFTVGDYDFSTTGEKTIPVSYSGFTTTFTVTVDPNMEVYPESAHNYENNTDESWMITKKGAVSISVTFSGDTKTESSYDFIYIYDKNDNQIGKYSGSALANQTVTVDGDTVRIRLTSDYSSTYYGFAVTDIRYQMGQTVPGDLSGDGVVDAKDVVAFKQVLLSGIIAGTYDAQYDINNDNAVDVRDLVHIKKIMAA